KSNPSEHETQVTSTETVKLDANSIEGAKKDHEEDQTQAVLQKWAGATPCQSECQIENSRQRQNINEQRQQTGKPRILFPQIKIGNRLRAEDVAPGLKETEVGNRKRQGQFPEHW